LGSYKNNGLRVLLSNSGGAELDRVRNFTLRAIVKIAQEVTKTSLRYE